MDKNTAINTTKKFFMGCGVVSFALFAIVLCIGIFVDDDEQAVTDSQVSQSDGHTDSLKVQGVLEGDPYEELESLTGMTEVKAEVKSLANFIKIQKQREAQGMKTPAISYHCVFTGSPGTGKTTVARILARIYKDLGVLKKGHLVETDRSGLVAEYVGQTAVKTNHVCDSAIGGVLFIDEAYALTDEHSGGYGGEAIATLLKRMEDDRDSLVVIVAGYTNEMKRFINSNPGLQSRFTRYINFPDFKPGELYEIYINRAKKYGYSLDSDADSYLRAHMKKVFEHKSRNFGNGRYVRNVFEKTITEQANRLSKKSNPSAKELNELTLDDVRRACASVKY
ncbi:MAG: AAA family ATPase [Paludibacteraceae bacterium]|jgi:SpoVK/Ycf46/Vps4 family AAA+-type ATPase|nr:AAA family ATPase [Paludibacteraceae bacterium]MBQ1836183.1 AAA family ATPase [Paludibacteraceae bacterium]MBR6076733.1 AAA family ATPase [Paludibacteraceae bacterium]MCM8871901.1 AAA family ATPase [Paludibacteraceae bacterium]